MRPREIALRGLLVSLASATLLACIGDGQRKTSNEPVTVKNLAGVAAIFAGEGRSCAITAVGELHCWGANGIGELGDGVAMLSGVPGAVFGY